MQRGSGNPVYDKRGQADSTKLRSHNDLPAGARHTIKPQNREKCPEPGKDKNNVQEWSKLVEIKCFSDVSPAERAKRSCQTAAGAIKTSQVLKNANRKMRNVGRVVKKAGQEYRAEKCKDEDLRAFFRV